MEFEAELSLPLTYAALVAEAAWFLLAARRESSRVWRAAFYAVAAASAVGIILLLVT